MKKTLSVLFAVLLTFSALALAVSAATVSKNAAVYDIITPKKISFSYRDTECEVVPRGNSTLESLIDGNPSKGLTTYEADGVVTFKNVDFVNRAAAGMPVHQPDEDIPTVCLALDFNASVSFDAVYVTLCYERAAGIGGMKDNRVIVETSKDGNVWVPVGDDGRFYMDSHPAGAVAAWEDEETCCVEECIVPLGETVSSRYVRLSFQFANIPEGDYWRWYGDVHDWCGLTEVGVAKYQSGRKAKVLTEEEATAEQIVLEGRWVQQKDDETVEITTFAKNRGAYDYTVASCALEQFRQTGLETETEEVAKGTFSLIGNQLLVVYADNTYDEFEVEIDENGKLVLDGGEESLSRYNEEDWTEPSESSDPSESDSSDVSSATSEESETQTSSTETASSDTSSKTDSSSKTPANADVASNTSSTGDADSDGFPIWAIILIVVAAVAVVAVVVVLVIKKKK